MITTVSEQKLYLAHQLISQYNQDFNTALSLPEVIYIGDTDTFVHSGSALTIPDELVIEVLDPDTVINKRCIWWLDAVEQVVIEVQDKKSFEATKAELISISAPVDVIAMNNLCMHMISICSE